MFLALLAVSSERVSEISGRDDCRKSSRDYDCYAWWLAKTSLVTFSTNENQNQNQAHWPMASRRDFSRALNKLQLIARNSDWFIALFVLVGIGQSNYLGIVFFDSHFKTTLLHIWEHKQPRYIFIFIFTSSLLRLPWVRVHKNSRQVVV